MEKYKHTPRNPLVASNSNTWCGPASRPRALRRPSPSGPRTSALRAARAEHSCAPSVDTEGPSRQATQVAITTCKKFRGAGFRRFFLKFAMKFCEISTNSHYTFLELHLYCFCNMTLINVSEILKTLSVEEVGEKLTTNCKTCCLP